MTETDARYRVALAGRELGSGPHLAVERLVPGVADRVFDEAKRRWEAHHDKTKAQFPWDERKEQMERLRAGSYAYGLAVGLVMAEQPEALATLDAIEREWRAETSG